MGTITIPADRVIPYLAPDDWIKYNVPLVLNDLIEAKAAVLALKAIPHQRDWVERLQGIQLKMEVAGTSRIEGADFTENELDEALDPSAQMDQMMTRSQRQARAAVATYRWIALLPDDLPITVDLMKEIHRRMVTGCDDDHCAPGELRSRDQNVTFGFPRHRGSEGGKECADGFGALTAELAGRFRDHDPLIQAMALHYHFASMHPFLDGNGRTARAIEALLLQRAGLRDTAFIAMSNYYYEEKPRYLSVLAEVRRNRHDLTAFLIFGLRGVRMQCDRLSREITRSVKKAVFRNMMYDLFSRLETPRKRVIAKRQIEILKVLLDETPLTIELYRRLKGAYGKLASPTNAFARDVFSLVHLGAVKVKHDADKPASLEANLDWPQQITETDFMAKIKNLPTAKGHGFLSF
ncbi:MAG: Fic family protein [Bryobacterales bacterium]